MNEDNSAPILYDLTDGIVTITLNRPEYHNAQNLEMLYALDDAFYRFAQDDDASVAILRGAGKNFSAGHDMGSPDIDYDVPYPPRTMWWNHVGKEGVENWMAWEQDAYVGLFSRWREIPKPTIAAVHGACIAAGLMLCWPCDLIIASDDAWFSDPVLTMGIPGVEVFAHPFELGPRQAKELLFTAERITASKAQQLGMINRVVPAADLDDEALNLAQTISEMPRLALALTKKAVNRATDSMGFQSSSEHAFGLHQLAQAHNALTTGEVGRGHTAKSMKEGEASGPGNENVNSQT